MYTTTKKIKVIIIDDNHDWCSTVKIMCQTLGYVADTSYNLEDAVVKIQNALTEDNPFSVAMVDMRFEVGAISVKRGKEVVKFIKESHPYIACIISSGAVLKPKEVLDLRDDYGVDYFLPKDEIEPDTLKEAFEKALKQISSGGTVEQRKRRLNAALERLQNAQAIYLENMASLLEREAKKGIDVDLVTKHEIDDHRERLKDIKTQIEALKLEIEQLK